jgi:phage replication-related protein YjqB (UPF0714/DUF867 family)
MVDKYQSFSDLAASETEGRDYERRLVKRESDIVIIAPHGGGIEQGTSEIAEAVAGKEFSLYCFNGIKGSDNEDLHITSTRFDEPQGLDLVKQSRVVIAIHGLQGEDKAICVGGLDERLKERFIEALNEAGFEAKEDAKEDNSHHPGTSPSNICNRGDTGRGVQLEITEGLRRTMFQSLKRRGRQTKRPPFYEFVDVIRNVLLDIRQEAE